MNQSSSPRQPTITIIEENRSGNELPRDEIKQFLDCGYIGPSEACHRIFGFRLHGCQPPVHRLEIHLPGEQPVMYEQGCEIVIADEATAEPGSRLLAYFECVKQSRLPNAERPLETSERPLEI